MSNLSVEILKKYHNYDRQIKCPFLKKLTLQPQVSKILTTLACSSIENPAIFCVVVFLFWSFNVQRNSSAFKNLNSTHELDVQEIRNVTHRSV